MTTTILEQSPIAATFSRLGPQAVAEIDASLANSTLPFAARSAWSAVRDIPAEIVATLVGAASTSQGNPIAVIAAQLRNKNLSADGRRLAVGTFMAALRDGIAVDVEKLTSGLSTVEESLRSAAYPTRPPGTDSIAELLARQHVQMVLDQVGADRVLRRAGELLSDALDANAVEAWLLCSGWFEDYLRASHPRFWADGGETAWRAGLDSVLATRGGTSVAAAQQALAAFSSKYGAMSLRILVAQLPGVLAQIERQGRLAATDPPAGSQSTPRGWR